MKTNVASSLVVLLSILGTGTYADVPTPFSNSVQNLVNSFRHSFRVPALYWNGDLAQGAQQCADLRAYSGDMDFSCSCGSAVETSGLSVNPAPSQGARAIISTPAWYGGNVLNQTYSWYAAFNDPYGSDTGCIDWSTPNYNGQCSHFTQMIWNDTTDFACAYSNPTNANGNHVLSCCWYPPGNVPGTFANNIFEDIV